MKVFLELYKRFTHLTSYLQSPFLLLVRLYWGWQLIQTGWGKLHNIAKITEFFGSLNIPFPSANAHFVAGLEFFGGILLIVGFGTRIVGLLMAGNMLVAYWTADREALSSIFSDQENSMALIHIPSYSHPFSFWSLAPDSSRSTCYSTDDMRLIIAGRQLVTLGLSIDS